MSQSMPPIPPTGAGDPGEALGGAEPSARSSRKGLAIGGTALAVALVGGGAYAAWSFLSTGSQPAEALPASTLGYVSIDVDPGGAQKIEAFRTLRKFPALQKELGLDTDDDLRELIVDEFLADSDCDLSFADDFAPWVGKKLALAAVPGAGDEVTPVIVVEVADEGAAEDGLGAVRDCNDDLGWAFAEGFVLVSPTEEEATAVAASLEDGTLADDEEFSTWVEEAGGSGFITGYVASAATPYVLDLVEEISEVADLGDLLGGGLATPGGPAQNPFAGMSDAELESMGLDPDLVEELYGPRDAEPGVVGPDTDALEEQLKAERERIEDALEDFAGAAMTVRFDDGGLRMEAVAGGMGAGEGETPAVSDLVDSLPASAGVLIALGVNDEWAEGLTSTLADVLGEGTLEEVERATGLDLPGDLQALLGDALALVVDGNLDAEAIANSFDPTDVPIGLRILGDPDEIGPVLDKLVAGLGADGALLSVERGDDGVAVGLSPAWVDALADGGDLTDNDRYDDVVSGDGDPASVFFIDFDAPWFASLRDALLGGDLPEVDENLDPLRALGISSWVEDDRARFVVELSTD